MNRQGWLVVFLFSFFTSQAEYQEFVYPVDTIEHEEQEKLCILHQKGNTLELWFWNPQTQAATKALLSSFCPAGLTVLPNKKGFSFIDNDRIRVKQVNKRSPKSIDLYGPYDLTTIQWIDNTSFCFGAKERQHGNLFHATTEGELYRLTVSDTNEYFYPQKTEDELFFIEKSEQGFSIKHTKYPMEEIKKHSQEKQDNKTLQARMNSYLEEKETAYQPYLDLDNSETVFLSSNTMNISFLKMISPEQGFFLEHCEQVERGDPSIHFSYYSFFKYPSLPSTNNNAWNIKKLFTFTLPLHLLLPTRGKARLYESILPLLPFINKEKIYFTSISPETQALDVFCYDLENETIEQKTFAFSPDQIYFTPRYCNNSLFSGGSILHDPMRTNISPRSDIDPSGTQIFSFVEIK